jgi:hypothetical protein
VGTVPKLILGNRKIKVKLNTNHYKERALGKSNGKGGYGLWVN